MGKQLVIKGADFSENALDVRNKRYWYNVPNSQFEAADAAVATGGYGYSLVNQSPIQGKTLHGMRLNVTTTGVMSIFKTSTNGAKDKTLLTEVATVQASETGIQDLDFSAPVVLGDDEYIVLGCNGKGTNTIVFNHHNTSTVPAPVITQTLYHTVGHANCAIGQNSISLDVDFYTKNFIA